MPLDSRYKAVVQQICLAAIVSVAALGGCEKPGVPTSTGPSPSQRVVNGPGVVQGRILFQGTPPVMKELNNQPCHEGAKTIREETVLVSADGGLANCFVWIDGIGPAAPRGGSPLLDQISCQYVPHALGVVIGQPLTVRSSDPTIHNVNFKGSKNPEINFGMTGANQERQVRFGAAEFLRVKCDVHPWMLAHVGVFENSYFAVTDSQGAFKISNLPAGEYKLRVWHELYGTRDQPVTISDQPQEISITYAQ